MLTKRDRTAMYKGLEEVQRLRIANVRFCQQTAGSWEELARWSGKSAQLLVNVAGPHPRRSIGESLARSLEFSLGLPALWFDQKH
jgi:hypothetical protein